jgi:hypothetical protein
MPNIYVVLYFYYATYKLKDQSNFETLLIVGSVISEYETLLNKGGKVTEPFFESKITTFNFERQHNQAHFNYVQRKLASTFLSDII